MKGSNYSFEQFDRSLHIEQTRHLHERLLSRTDIHPESLK